MEEIAFENGRISNFQGLMTLTLDRVILNTVVHHSSTSTYMPNFIEIEETFCGRTVEHLGPTLLGRLRILSRFLHLWLYDLVWTDGRDVHTYIRTEGRTDI